MTDGVDFYLILALYISGWSLHIYALFKVECSLVWKKEQAFGIRV